MAQYYYGTSGPIPLEYDTLHALIKIDESIPGTQVEELLGSIPRIIDLIPHGNVIDGFVACSLTAQAGYEAFIDSLIATEGILLAEPFLLSWNTPDKPMGIMGTSAPLAR